MTGEKVHQILARIAKLPIDVDRHAVPRHELLALALRFGLSSHDATYLELASRRQPPLATQQKALRAAALAAGVMPSAPVSLRRLCLQFMKKGP